MKCPECGHDRMEKGKWIDVPNLEVGEYGVIEQDIRYYPNCMYQIEVNEE